MGDKFKSFDHLSQKKPFVFVQEKSAGIDPLAIHQKHFPVLQCGKTGFQILPFLAGNPAGGFLGTGQTGQEYTDSDSFQFQVLLPLQKFFQGMRQGLMHAFQNGGSHTQCRSLFFVQIHRPPEPVFQIVFPFAGIQNPGT